MIGERSTERAQRLRVHFAREGSAVQIGHLDITRHWERAFAQAGIAVSYSQGARKQPRIANAAGLPSGVTSEGELLDVVLAERIDPASAVERVQAHLPEGLRAIEAWEVGLGGPALPALVRWADYEVEVAAGLAAAQEAVERLLAAERLPWVDTRGEKVREYDLRPLVGGIKVAAVCEGRVRLSMRLRAGQDGVGRPDQVAKALGLAEPLRVHRARLVLDESPPAHEGWRRRGRYE